VSDAARTPDGRWRLLVAAGAATVAVVALLLVALPGLGTETIEVEVAPGTAQRLAAGAEVDLLPRTLEVSVGDRLEIVNRDDVTHEVGPYTVAAGQTLRQTFTSVGTLEGACTLHPSGAITIVVR
jgi:plastocyanin